MQELNRFFSRVRARAHLYQRLSHIFMDTLSNTSLMSCCVFPIQIFHDRENSVRKQALFIFARCSKTP